MKWLHINKPFPLKFLRSRDSKSRLRFWKTRMILFNTSSPKNTKSSHFCKDNTSLHPKATKNSSKRKRRFRCCCKVKFSSWRITKKLILPNRKPWMSGMLKYPGWKTIWANSKSYTKVWCCRKSTWKMKFILSESPAESRLRRSINSISVSALKVRSYLIKALMLDHTSLRSNRVSLNYKTWVNKSKLRPSSFKKLSLNSSKVRNKSWNIRINLFLTKKKSSSWRV